MLTPPGLHCYQNIFESHVATASPPCSKNQPPVAGAISWSRSLKRRIMKPIVRFQTMDEMKSAKGQEIMAKYIEVAKAMRDYEDQLFEEWKATVELMTSEQMQSKLLREVAPGEDGASIEEMMEQTGGMPPEPKIVVNFNPGLMLTIRETKYLGQLDARFKIPQKAQNVFLQGEKYYKYVAEIKDMLENYHAAIDALTPAERTLLQHHVDELQACLRPGFVTLNWNSLGITDFIDNCGKGINDFQSISSQVQKTAANIEGVVFDLATAVLVVPPVRTDPAEVDVLETTEFAEAIEKARARTLEGLVAKYRSISMYLGKIESLVDGDGAGGGRMKEYYKFWERKIYDAIVSMVVNGLTDFRQLLTNGELRHEVYAAAPGFSTGGMLFRITANFHEPELLYGPTVVDVQKMLHKMIENIYCSAKSFIRWMDGMCEEAVDTRPGIDDENRWVYHFYNDIRTNSQIFQLVMELGKITSRTGESLRKFLRQWKQHDKLWKLNKTTVLEKFVATDPTCVEYDQKLFRYHKEQREFAARPPHNDVDFVRVICAPVVKAMEQQARAWVEAIGVQLLDGANVRMLTLQATIAEYTENMLAKPKKIDQLKFLLNAISEIKNSSMERELEYMDIAERYRTLELYSIVVPDEAKTAAGSLGPMWMELLMTARVTEVKLAPVKRKFTAVTVKQVDEFKILVQATKEEFEASGPNHSSVDMDQGVELMDEYAAKMATMNDTRNELVLAQKLFNLDITSYPELASIEGESTELVRYPPLESPGVEPPFPIASH